MRRPPLARVPCQEFAEKPQLPAQETDPMRKVILSDSWMHLKEKVGIDESEAGFATPHFGCGMSARRKTRRNASACSGATGACALRQQRRDDRNDRRQRRRTRCS